MEKTLLIIPFMTFFANLAILLNIPVFREIVVFMFLSFIPGFAILNLFKLKETNFLEISLFSVALSIAFVMFTGLLVNEVYLFLGLAEPLTTIPLTVTISALTMIIFLVECRGDFSEIFKSKKLFEVQSKAFVPLIILSISVPVVSAIGVLYLNVPLILLSYGIISVLSIVSVSSKRLVPRNLLPIVIFSITVALACQVPLTSKYITGFDANLEYYVFRLTQINGFWGSLNANVNSVLTFTYNSMLSVTILPTVYSALMNAQGSMVFKLLYPFLFCLVPLALYRTCEIQFGKTIGYISALFFVFTSTAFFGVGPLDLNRQIVAELFLALCIFLLINKAIPVAKRRWLLIFFGAALVVSHYTIAYFFLGIVAVIFIISRIKPEFDDTLDGKTVLLLFMVALGWYAIGSSPLLTSLSETSKLIWTEITSGVTPAAASTSASMFALPRSYTLSTWVNLLLSAVTNLFLIIGVLVVILGRKKIGISALYGLVTIAAGAILAVSYISPSIASILNFTRFYGITLLFLSLCIVLGGQMLLGTIGKVFAKIRRDLNRQISSKDKRVDWVFLLIAIVMGAYFLSQVGFVNRVTDGPVHSYVLDFSRLIGPSSNLNQIAVQTSILYDDYIPEQDAFSASWLSHYGQTAQVFADPLSQSNVLLSYGLIPNELLFTISNTTVLPQGSFFYLDTFNSLDNVINTSNGTISTSQIFPLLNQTDLVYSNGNSRIWYAPTQ